MMTSVSRRYLATRALPPLGSHRLAQATDGPCRASQVAAIAPHARQPIDDRAPFVRARAPVALRDRVADERRHRRAPPPALGGELARHLLVEIELRAPHRRCMTYIGRGRHPPADTPRHRGANRQG